MGYPRSRKPPYRPEDADAHACTPAGHAGRAATGPEPAHERRLPRHGPSWCGGRGGSATLGRGTGAERARALQGAGLVERWMVMAMKDGKIDKRV